MSEQLLRDLLRRAVPEAPDLDPAAIGRRAARQRRNRRSWLGASASVGAIVMGTLAYAGLDGDVGTPQEPRVTPSQQLSPPVTQPTPSDKQDEPLAPDDVPPCPAQLPEGPTANHTVTDLAGVVAVRVCPDLNPRGREVLPSVELLAELEDADALVDNLADFVADLRSLPPGLPDYCSDDQDAYVGWSFAFDRRDGTRELVATQGCHLVTVEGRRVDSEVIRRLYLTALDRQRDELTYSRVFDDKLTCTSNVRGGPIQPGRERLVAAVACDIPDGAESIPMDLKPIQLDPAQLAELNRAWADPGDRIVRGPSGEHECLDLPEPPTFILAATNRSDVVQLFDSPCGFLVWHGWEPHPGATLPTTMKALGQ